MPAKRDMWKTGISQSCRKQNDTWPGRAGTGLATLDSHHPQGMSEDRHRLREQFKQTSSNLGGVNSMQCHPLSTGFLHAKKAHWTAQDM